MTSLRQHLGQHGLADEFMPVEFLSDDRAVAYGRFVYLVIGYPRGHACTRRIS